MGADLYIEKVFTEDPRLGIIGKKLDEARDALKELPEDAVKKTVKRYERRETALCNAYSRICDKMYCVDGGYFRDSYNSSNLLSVLGLNYWIWLAGFEDGNRYIHPQHAKIILDKIVSRPVTEKRLKQHLKDRKIALGKNDKPADEEFKDWLAYFSEKRERFIRFLKMAIEADSPILCSI